MSNNNDNVQCDACGVDFTVSIAVGGFLFMSKAICPICAPNWESTAKNYKETHFITKRCPDGKPFADWVREDLR